MFFFRKPKIVVDCFTDDNQIGEFFEDGVSKGFGNSINITYSPSTTFGSKRVYTFESLNVKSLYYYEVEIISKYKDAKQA